MYSLADYCGTKMRVIFRFRGMYVCRTLSYKGAEFEVVEVPLEAKMTVPSSFLSLQVKKMQLQGFLIFYFMPGGIQKSS